jgi:hypothetical protein
LKKWYLMREAVNGNQGHSWRIGYLMREVIMDNQGHSGRIGYLMREVIMDNQGHSGRIGYLMREVINGNHGALRGLLVFISSVHRHRDQRVWGAIGIQSLGLLVAIRFESSEDRRLAAVRRATRRPRLPRLLDARPLSQSPELIESHRVHLLTTAAQFRADEGGNQWLMRGQSEAEEGGNQWLRREAIRDCQWQSSRMASRAVSFNRWP